ncbi:PAS domain-containing protein [Azospirillum canadense]|uniref:PAS domain-containing protein n=1 Tax=Azospirillum canadense TaxID=403962 RepID=UPI0022276B42|nr:PAS domain-containing protein [Azospirillum canadense]MCW2240941.1 PAS domain S-box-containing protein [Azospirillum canadense]
MEPFRIILVADINGSIVFADPKAEQFSGLKQADFLGDGWLWGVHPRDRLLAKTQWRKSVLYKNVYEEFYRYRKYDGTYHWLLTRSIPLSNFRIPAMHWAIVLEFLGAENIGGVAMKENHFHE